jgi:hypothetical protein
MGTMVKIRFHMRKFCSQVSTGTAGMYELVDTSSEMEFRIFIMMKMTLAGAFLESIQKVI